MVSQLKLMGLTSTFTTPPKCGIGPTKHILHLTSTPPLPHLYHNLSIKITGRDLYPYHALKMWYWSHKIYTRSHLYPTSTTPPPTKITGIDIYLYHTLKKFVQVPTNIQYMSLLTYLYHTSVTVSQLKLMGLTSTTLSKCTSTSPLLRHLQLKLLG